MTHGAPARSRDAAPPVRLKARAVNAPGGPIEVFETVDISRDLDAAIAAGTVAPYGRVLWASAVCVAKVLAREPLAGRSVLELGCGVGLVSLVAARAGAQVLATDVDPGALEATRRGVDQLGPAGARVCVEHFDVESALQLPPADIVVAADMLFESPLALAVARRALEALARGSRVLLGDPGRAGRDVLVSSLDAAGVVPTVERVEAPPDAADVLFLTPARGRT